MPLHIFEPRYREMVALCLREDRPFGIVHASESKMAEVGTTAWIRRVVTRYDDGRLDIVCVGETRFRVGRLHRDRSFLAADVEMIEDADEPDDEDLRQRVITQHMRLLEMAGEEPRPGLYDAPAPLSFLVAKSAGLRAEPKQALIEAVSENERLVFLADHFADVLRRVQTAREMRDLAQGDGHSTGFPDLDP